MNKEKPRRIKKKIFEKAKSLKLTKIQERAIKRLAKIYSKLFLKWDR